MSELLMLEYYAGVVFACILGMCLGSFASAVAYRVPRGMSFASISRHDRRSQCPGCGKNLSIRDLVPIVSYIVNRGRCRYCKSKIGMHYPVMELGCGLLCTAIYVVFGVSLEALFLMTAVPIIAAVIMVDVTHYRIPNRLTMIFAILGVLFQVTAIKNVSDIWFDMYFVAVSVLLFYLCGLMIRGIGKVMFQKESLGYGDVKLFAAIGIWLPWYNLAEFLIFSGIIGLIFGTICRLQTGNRVFPFGPAIVCAFLLCFFLNARDFNVLLIKI